jgi:hypothetical protein
MFLYLFFLRKSQKGVFPEPKHDPVIMIACYVTRQGESTPFIRNIFTVRGCSNIIGAEATRFFFLLLHVFLLSCDLEDRCFLFPPRLRC